MIMMVLAMMTATMMSLMTPTTTKRLILIFCFACAATPPRSSPELPQLRSATRKNLTARNSQRQRQLGAVGEHGSDARLHQCCATARGRSAVARLLSAGDSQSAGANAGAQAAASHGVFRKRGACSQERICARDLTR